jgi:hypothetical protein
MAATWWPALTAQPRSPARKSVVVVPAILPHELRGGGEDEDPTEDPTEENPNNTTMTGKFKDWLLLQLIDSKPSLVAPDAPPVEVQLPHLFSIDLSRRGNQAKITQLTDLLYARTRPLPDDIVVFNKVIHCYERLGQLDKVSLLYASSGWPLFSIRCG